MKLLKNKRAWQRFLRNDVSYYPSQIKDAKEPDEYPCYAYAVVQSYAYEEQAPVYLYLGDIEKMEVALRKIR